MSKLIAATYHPNIEVAEFICEDGRHLLRSGGTLPWRIHNPGDLTARVVNGVPAPRKARGYVGFATNKSGTTFLIFPDKEAGRAELKAHLMRMHGDRTLPEAIAIYAPKSENNTQKYTDDLLRVSGIPANRKIVDCSDADLEKVADSISEIEGYHATPETRKETWVTVSTINASDGSRPLPDTEIVLQKGGKEEVVRSDATGRFPPVIHPADKTAVHVKVVNPKTKEPVKVGIIQGDTGRDFNLLAQFRKWKGVAESEKINSSTAGQRRPMSYVVQPGDNLGKIAKLYRTGVAAIKDGNGLSSDRIYPGEVLLIGGSGTEKSKDIQSASAAAVHKAVPASAAVVPKKHPLRAPSPAPSIPLGAQPSDFERSKEGAGKVLALINPVPGRAPWMPIAVAEAKLRRGELEAELENKINYHIEIGDGQKSMTGKQHAWCAAFVNWCLMQAKYPIDNKEFLDHRAAMGRAHSFYEIKGEKMRRPDDPARMVRNSLFVELSDPIYGAIAMVTSKNGHGCHVGFVYAKNGNEDLILLGGNQSDKIRFSIFPRYIRDVVKVKGKNGKWEIEKEASLGYLKYFAPVAYYESAKRELYNPGLEEMNLMVLNLELGIPPDAPKRKIGPSSKNIS